MNNLDFVVKFEKMEKKKVSKKICDKLEKLPEFTKTYCYPFYLSPEPDELGFINNTRIMYSNE
jgi:hypothetical protein